MPVPAFAEYLVIGSVTLGTRASWATNLYVLRNEARKGEDRLLGSGVPGRRPYARERDSVAHVLELVIAADFDSDGVPTASLAAGQEANIAELAAIAEPVATTAGTRSVSWHKRTGAVVSADCHVGPLTIGEEFDDAVLATLDIVVPVGAFTV